MNLVGNRVIAPHGDDMVYGVRVLGQRPVSLFVQGNLGPHRTRDDQPEVLFVSPNNASRSRATDQPRQSAPIAAVPATRAYEEVLTSAGSTRPQRDAVDRRIVADVRQQHARLIRDPAEVGGWPELASAPPSDDSDHDGMPDAWETRHGFDPTDASDGSGDADGDVSTNLEEFLNGTDPAS